MNKINSVISKNIKKYRKLNGMTQKDLSQKVGVSIAAVSNWETGTNSIDIDSLFSVCNALGVSISDITEEENTLVLNKYEKELIYRFREAKTWEQLSVMQTLHIGIMPPHLVRYWEIINDLSKK